MVALTDQSTGTLDGSAADPFVERRPLLWGLSETELHSRFWAARGVAVVRAGSSDTRNVPAGAELYLLTDATTLVLFRVRLLVDLLSWARPDVLYVRIRSLRVRPYRESAITNRHGRFLRFERGYDARRLGLARVALTADAELARQWQAMPDARAAWKMLRRASRSRLREVSTINGRTYDGADNAEVSEFVRDLVGLWKHPDSTIPDLRNVAPGVWAHAAAVVADDARFIGPVWVGAAQVVQSSRVVLGPTALRDECTSAPALDGAAARSQGLAWDEIEPSESFRCTAGRPAVTGAGEGIGKRAFDVAFATLALIVAAPIFLLTALAILLEDGRPIFFVHRREGRGGREFGCIKFRSMRKDADEVKAKLAQANQADGPQFYIDSDPRVTRVGRVIRKLNIDELPQFINVLLGNMSVVGPRPSPFSENQFCPSSREARLSVRPGITGLWQVCRTRQRGLDFQEWIRFDLEYVKRHGLVRDVQIVLRTVVMLLTRKP